MPSDLVDRLRGVRSSQAIKVPCRVATTANITLSGEQTIDGVAVVDGDRVLVKNQSTASENGIYECDTSTWSRAPDWDGTGDVVTGTRVYVTAGTTNKGEWVVTTTGTITIGTTSVVLSGGTFDKNIDTSDDITEGSTKLLMTVAERDKLEGIPDSILSEVVDDTTPQLGGNLDTNGQNIDFDDSTGIRDDSGNEQLIFQKTASAVNHVEMTNAATGNHPSIAAAGDDTNIHLDLAGKGTGKVRAAGSPVLKANGAETLTAGFDATSVDNGTKSTGTFTPTFQGGNIRRYINGGAHTLAPPTGEGCMMIQVTNNGSAGAITTSGFTKVTGDTITTTNGHDFFLDIRVVNGFSQLHVTALQ